MFHFNLESILDASLEERRAKLEQWNKAYRMGNALVDDQSYDLVLDSLPINDPFRNQVGVEPSDQRKTTLPIPMYSMDKVKSLEEIHKWMDSKKIAAQEIVVITPKFDGLSFLVHPDSGKAYTRGNGKEGQRSDIHFAMLMSNKQGHLSIELMNRHIIGEVIMPKSVFEESYSQDFRNPRNLVAGLFNQKEAQAALKDVHFIAYGCGEELEDKSKTITHLASYNSQTLPHEICTLDELTEDKLLSLFALWSADFEIDGLIVEIDNLNRRRELGREKNNNPCYARAWKGFEASSAMSTIEGLTFQISKDGRLTIVGQLTPIQLDGVTVSNVTLNNASMVIERGWGIGAKVRVIRSGMVIPKIVGTDERCEPILPSTCPSCQSTLVWDNNHVHIKCPNSTACPAQQIQTAIAFFKIMNIDEVGEKIVEQLFEAGYDSIAKICSMKVEHFLSLDRFAEKRAQLIYNNIHSKLQNVPLEQIQHASGCFKGLGRKKLALTSHFSQPDQKPELETLLNIDGFSEISAKAYLAGLDAFWTFVQALPLTIGASAPKVSNAAGRCSGLKFCFTGFRDKTLQDQIESEGGEIQSAVSGKTTHVITKDSKSSSSKIQKARDLGILIWEPNDLKDFLN